MAGSDTAKRTNTYNILLNMLFITGSFIKLFTIQS